ncbi:MAG: hypothetical protein COB50_04570 [Thiotrichales bacterium]|nr:MAG: hypothetical protein COB50_04570 [Thiotrichales bacterium]
MQLFVEVFDAKFAENRPIVCNSIERIYIEITQQMILRINNTTVFFAKKISVDHFKCSAIYSSAYSYG